MEKYNVRRILEFGENQHVPLTLSDFESRYGFAPDGRNWYYGIGESTVSHWHDTGQALGPQHQAFFEDLVAALDGTDRQEVTADFGLFPYGVDDPFTFVNHHLELVEQLAVELNAYQDRANGLGKRLDIVLRYASEMNDPPSSSQGYGRQPQNFKESFRLVREAFRSQAPDVRFAFSPALRSDIVDQKYQAITTYWPGVQYVDIISCTWYVGKQTELSTAIEVLRKYFLQRVGRALPFGIDEMGGVDGAQSNDAVLQQMFSALEVLAAQGVTFEYATVFLRSKWGNDATLEFLREGTA